MPKRKFRLSEEETESNPLPTRIRLTKEGCLAREKERYWTNHDKEIEGCRIYREKQ